MKSLATIARSTVAAEKRVSSVVIVARYTFKDEARKAYSVYVVRSSDGNATYTCTLVNGKATGCECPAHKPCKHETACERAEQRITAQKAARAEELAVAAVVAPLVLGSFSEDLQVHLEDEMPAQPVQVSAADQVFSAITMDTIIDLRELARELRMGMEMAGNCLTVLQRNGRIVFKWIGDDKYWVNTPDAAYRTVFYGDFAA